MKKLLLSGFFLPITFIVNAATVQPTELTSGPVQFVEQKKNTTPGLQATVTELTEGSILSSGQQQQNTLNSTPAQRESSHNKDALPFPPSTIELAKKNNATSSASLKSFARKLENEYGDNALFQQSLSTLYEAKQLWSEADSLANNLAYDFFSTLKLEQIIEHDLMDIQKPLTKQTNTFTQHQQADDISLAKIRQAQVKGNTSAYNYSALNHEFLDSLFRIETVFYLIGLYLFFMLLLSAIKFTLRFFP
ncbi:MAG: hypothetical protein GQ583_10325 [Methyloprofundus sp.]|nr:hypothetical protein [Methyloprofundus sp.]